MGWAGCRLRLQRPSRWCDFYKQGEAQPLVIGYDGGEDDLPVLPDCGGSRHRRSLLRPGCLKLVPGMSALG